MLKEIHEQADAVAETIGERAAPMTTRSTSATSAAIDDDLLRGIQRIVIVACGTSYHAGLVGRYAIEEWARVPVEVEIASEYRYRNPVVGPDDLVIGISQSGETADTLAAMRTAKAGGASVLAVTQHDGLADDPRGRRRALHARRASRSASPRPRRSSTQVVALYLLALRLAELRGTLAGARPDRARSRELKHLPHLIVGGARRRHRASSSGSPPTSTSATSSCTSAATPACRSRSRARSSSRRSPTSRPTPTRPAR